MCGGRAASGSRHQAPLLCLLSALGSLGPGSRWTCLTTLCGRPQARMPLSLLSFMLISSCTPLQSPLLSCSCKRFQLYILTCCYRAFGFHGLVNPGSKGWNSGDSAHLCIRPQMFSFLFPCSGRLSGRHSQDSRNMGASSPMTPSPHLLLPLGSAVPPWTCGCSEGLHALSLR